MRLCVGHGGHRQGKEDIGKQQLGLGFRVRVWGLVLGLVLGFVFRMQQSDFGTGCPALRYGGSSNLLFRGGVRV